MLSQLVGGWDPMALQRWWDRALKEDGGEEEEPGANEYLDTETEKEDGKVFSNYNADGEWLDFSSTPQAPSEGMSYLVADRAEGKVDKEVQTMTTEQTRWRWMTSEGVPDEELDTDTEIGLSWD